MAGRDKGRGGHGNKAVHALAHRLKELSDTLQRPMEKAGATVDVFHLDLTAASKEEWLRRAAQILSELEQRAEGESSAWRGPSIWCFQCSSGDCGHSRPPSPRHVLEGYLATGKPTWRPFLDVCLEHRPPGLDGLYATPPGVVVLSWAGDELKEERLNAFGIDGAGYEVLSQVVVGLLDPRLTPGGRGESDLRVPLTIQVIRLPGKNLKEPYRIKLLGFKWRDIDEIAATVPPRHPAQQLGRTLRHLRKRLRALPRRIAVFERRGEPVNPQNMIERMMSRLAGDLRRTYRIKDERTKHAQKRHRSGERPTNTAWSDSRSATPDKLLYDTRRETYVVVGKKGRAHVFSPSGKHITSLRLEDGEIDRKLRRKRWRVVNASEFSTFQRLTSATGNRSHG